MKVAIITSIEQGFASVCIPNLVNRHDVELTTVILADRAPAGRWRRFKRILSKTMRIGPRGAMNGLRLRRWYTDDVASRLRIPPLQDLCEQLHLRLLSTPTLNSPRTVELLNESRAELALSLGNAYIAPRVFSAPRLGMLNVHHELLPEFKGAQSVLWQLHEGSTMTGYTIHRVDRTIDGGDILVREELPIQFGDSLHQTVVSTYAALLTRSAERLGEVVESFDTYLSAARPQSGGRTFTTPSWREFRRMLDQHERLRTRKI